MKIYLIGMPGSGKTTLGKKLAEELAMPFVDLDKEIEQHEGKSIPEIFSQQGEEHFRQVESALLLRWAASNQSFVMATGGGAPCFYDGIEVMNETGLSVFLDSPLRELIKRLDTKTDRPLLNSDKINKEVKLGRLHAQRLKIYQKARVTVGSPDFRKVLNAIQFNT